MGIGAALTVVGAAVGAYGSVKGGKAAEKAAQLRADVTRRRGELEMLFNTIQEHNLWNYVGALESFYEQHAELNQHKLQTAEQHATERAVNEQARYQGTLDVLDQRGVLAENTYMDKQFELGMRAQHSTAALGLETGMADALDLLAYSELGVDRSLIGIGAQQQRVSLQGEGIGLMEQGIGLQENRIGLQERGIGLSEELLGRQEAEQGFITELLQSDERSRRTGLAIQAARGEEAAQLAQLDADTQRQESILQSQIATSRKQAELSDAAAANLQAQARLVREQAAVSTIQGLGQQALRTAGSGIAFNSTSLSDRRAFQKNQAVKATLSKVVDVLHQADAKKVEAFVRRQEGSIAQFNMNHVKLSQAIKSSNIRLQTSIEQENFESQGREIGYQQQLLNLKRENSVRMQGMTMDKHELLNQRFDMNAQRGALLGERFGLLDQKFQLVDAEEAAKMIGAENKFVRHSVQNNYRRGRAQLDYQGRSIEQFSQSQAALRAYENTFLTLTQSRVNEDYRYNEAEMNNWYDYQSAITAFNSAELDRFRTMSSDEFNINTRLLNLYQGSSNAYLAHATGTAGEILGSNAALQGWVGAAGGLLTTIGGLI